MARELRSRSRRGGRSLPPWCAVPLVVGAGCTSLLGVDGEYRSEDGGGAPGASSSTGDGTGGDTSTMGAVGSGGSGGSGSSASSGGSGGGGSGGGQPGLLPACEGVELAVRPFISSDERDRFVLYTASAELGEPRLRHGPGGVVVTWTDGTGSAVLRGGTITPVALTDLVPFDVGSSIAAGRDGDGNLVVIDEANVPTTSAAGPILEQLLDARKASPQSARFLVVPQGESPTEDWEWYFDLPFGLNQRIESGCQTARAAAFVDEADGVTATICTDDTLRLTGREPETTVGDALALAAARQGDHHYVVVVRADGAVVAHVTRPDVDDFVAWSEPILLGEGVVAGSRPSVTAVAGGVFATWSRDGRLFAALCTAGPGDAPPVCCDPGIEAALLELPVFQDLVLEAPAIDLDELSRIALAVRALSASSEPRILGARLDLVALGL